MDVTPLVWGVTAAAVVALVVFDFMAHVRTAHTPSFGESARWSLFYVGLAVVFGIGLGVVAGWGPGSEFFAGYVTEKSLSVDNLFVFLVIITAFAVPPPSQQKVLLAGVVIALVLRTVFILLGAAAIERFSWVFYAFGALLVWTAVRLARQHHDPAHPPGPAMKRESPAVRLLKRVVPTAEEFDGDRMVTRVDGRRMMTPMLVVMVAIGSTDVLFALDSIPAIYGLTHEPYLVFTANAFALLGLRQLYFLIGGLLDRLVYLSQGLAVILAFIGVKLVLEALHTNELPFVNGGEPVEWAPQVPIWLSLTVIVGTLAVATVASLVATGKRRDATGDRRGATGDRREATADPRDPTRPVPDGSGAQPTAGPGARSDVTDLSTARTPGSTGARPAP